MKPDTGSRRRPPGRRFLLEWLAIGVLGVAAVLAGVAWQSTASIDRLIYDHLLAARRLAPDPAIVVVEIDNPSLERLGRWPWPRSVHAQLLERLAQARPAAVVYDVLFTEASPDDAQLAAALARVPTWLPVLLGPENAAGARALTLPVPPLAARAAGMGHINFEVDPDGIVRSVALTESDGRRDWPQLMLAVARGITRAAAPAAGAALAASEAGPSRQGATPAGAMPHASRFAASLPGGRYLIPFSRGTPAYSSCSLADVLAGKVPDAALRGKVIVVGVTAAGLYDRFATPISGEFGPLPGVYLHANVLDMLLTGRAISPVSRGWLCLASLPPLAALLAGILLLSPRRALLLALSVAALSVAGSAALLYGARLWLTPAPAILGLIVVYPTWNWRRLDMTMAYLRDELERLAAEPHLLPESPRASGARAEFGGDPLERQMNLMAQAARRVQDMKRFVWDSLDSVPEPIFVTDVAGIVLIANHAARRYCARLRAASPEGRPLPAALGELAFVKSVAHPEREPDLRAAWPDALDPTRGEAPALLASGLEVRDADGLDHLLRYAPCTNAEGQAIGWIAGLVDVTALHAAERQREEALHLLSHDMRSPQASILALVRTERQRRDAGPAQRELLARIERHAQRALTLADEFVQLARAESQTYRIDVVNLADLLLDASDEVWPQAQAKRIRIDTALGEAPCWIGAERSLMTRALVNLLSNAIKYSPADTLVRCTLAFTEAPPRVTCTIRDQGYGIAPEHQRHLFERFRRFHAGERPEIAGTGLGMVFVKTVVTRHGGGIAVDSAPGRGTAIAITLPRLTDVADP
ncbi:CHASE2 domain-containing protein [Burkholderia glumae]|uniref:histidine kinase n=1 Tax=Burkholderia glumae TaxID=337 RepID=A0AAP9Y4H7_BURGL|nr:CHASE2 domain-containing protein [Burkholderia glumae]AJY65821.1 his Kinase A domain protein [Burkholderia glumae LMG 2196 = ATCC 33617]PNL01201.1 CHASE2 domain-containing protein [Burkholderia glumae]QPQ93122.1 CHASE2 domain-containing protein [Burkholderia glumae]QQM91675.1 CHASE2 domain-containing protein [Burkholderia glumae]